MSGREPMSGTHDCGGDAAAYALGALEAHEAEAFRAHMQECAVCRDEVEAYGGVVQSLPLATPQYQAPRALRRRVMHQVRAEQAGAGRLERTRSRLLAGAAAVAVAAGAVVAGIELTAGTAATVISAQMSGVSGSAQLRVSNGHAELVVHHLTPPGRGRRYEVWLQSGSAAPVPAGLFGVSRSGNNAVSIPGNIHGVSAVLVTPEPYRGSPKPTHNPVITARLD